jgi:hypothetical protein
LGQGTVAATNVKGDKRNEKREKKSAGSKDIIYPEWKDPLQ